MLNSPREVRDSARMLESYTNEGRPQQFYEELHTLVEGHEIDRGRLSMRNVFENFVPDGTEVLQEMRHAHRSGQRATLVEANDTVDTSAFSNIIGQVTYQGVLDRLDSPDFIGRNLVTTVPATTQQAEIIPGISVVGDVAEDVGEGQEYPHVTLSEEYVTAPRKVKDGFIIPVTEEAILEDKTGLLMQRVNTASEGLGITMEREILDTVLGQTTSYSRNGGAAQATYGDTHTNGDFDNLSASTALVDYTDIEAALLLFDAITDPNTGDPVNIGGVMDVVVPTALEMTLLNILDATGISVGDQTSATVPVTMSTNPLRAQRRRTFRPWTSQYVKDRTSSASTWFIGAMAMAFEYREIWPVQMFTQDRNSGAGFSRDVVTQLKVRRKGAPAVVEPRKAVKCTA